MKKIAYITPAFPIMSETFVGNEIRAIQRLGHNIELLTFEHKQEPAQMADILLANHLIELKNVPLTDTLKALAFSSFGLHSAMQFVNQQTGLPKRSLMWYGSRLAAHINKTGCQHIHAHFGLASTATAIVASKLTKTSISFTCHGYDIYRSPADLPLKLNHSCFAVAVSNKMKQDMFQLAPNARTIVVPCGVDTSTLDPSVMPHYQSKRFIYLGRLSETKGVDVLLKALSKIEPLQRPQLDIVGDGLLKSALIELRDQLNLTNWVHFLGQKPAHWLHENHTSYQCLVAPFVITTAGIQDTGPLVLKEAMMYHLPILTTDVAACQEMLLDETAHVDTPTHLNLETANVDTHTHLNLGEMIPWGNINALTLGIQTIMSKSPDELKAMGEAGAQYLQKHFLIDQQAEILSNAFESCR